MAVTPAVKPAVALCSCSLRSRGAAVRLAAVWLYFLLPPEAGPAAAEAGCCSRQLLPRRCSVQGAEPFAERRRRLPPAAPLQLTSTATSVLLPCAEYRSDSLQICSHRL